jgi:hypothetical protein
MNHRESLVSAAFATLFSAGLCSQLHNEAIFALSINRSITIFGQLEALRAGRCRAAVEWHLQAI